MSFATIPTLTLDCGFVGTQNLKFTKAAYADDGLAIQAYTDDGEPWSTISVNLWDEVAEPGCIFCDTNNNKGLVESLVAGGYLELTGRIGLSGYCTYPEARVTEKFEAVIGVL